MKKFKCTVTKETTMEIEIDSSIWTKEQIAEWQKYFYDAENIEDVVSHIARLKSECENGEFIEGFGVPMIDGKVVYPYLKESSINICNQDSDVNVEVNEITQNKSFMGGMKMFSSNQILEVSGDLSQGNDLYNALEFALKVSGNINSFTRAENPSKCVYQITDDGRYCVGWLYKDIEDGWTEFQFDFDLGIISQIILNHLRNQEIEKDIWDGGYHKGFIMKAIPESMGDEYDGIKKPFYGIVEFKPYTCFYSR